VVLPVHNEAANIEHVVREWTPVLAAADPTFVLLAVDDGSTDGTAEILARLAAADPRIRIVRQENRGHGAACLAGYTLATAPDSDAAFVLQIDSDGQCDPDDFPRLWAARHRHAQQFGSRRARRDGALRALTSRIFGLLATTAARHRVPDPNVPFRLLRRDALAGALARLHDDGPVTLANAALTVACVEAAPVHWQRIGFRERHAGRSHYGAGRMARLLVDFLRWLASGHGPDGRTRRRRLALRTTAVLVWCALAAAAALHVALNIGNEAIWYDEAMQVHTSLGVNAFGPPFAPRGSLLRVVSRNGVDQLDPGGFGVLLHWWMLAFGTSVVAMRTLSALLVIAGLIALATLARRWIRHPLAPPAAVGLAMLDPLVREHALEIRPYALELAGVFLAFWSADRLLARPERSRGLVLGAVLAALIGSRYSAFFTAAALVAAVLWQLWPLHGPERRPYRDAAVAMLAPPALASAIIGLVSVPALIRRATWNGGALVDYLDRHKALGFGIPELVKTALEHLVHPAALGLTVVAVLALRPANWRTMRRTDNAASRLVGHAALILLLLTAALWRWHPWDPATKWSLYLRLVSLVCIARLAADLMPFITSRATGRVAALAVSLAIVAGGATLAASHRRGRPDVAYPALVHLTTVLSPDDPAAVAVDAHPTPAVHYHYEHGALRGRPEYPQAFQLWMRDGIRQEQLCRARWLISFDRPDALAARYPALRFERDPAVPHLWRVLRTGSAAGGCGTPSDGGAGARGSSGPAR